MQLRHVLILSLSRAGAPYAPRTPAPNPTKQDSLVRVRLLKAARRRRGASRLQAWLDHLGSVVGQGRARHFPRSESEPLRRMRLCIDRNFARLRGQLKSLACKKAFYRNTNIKVYANMLFGPNTDVF